MWGYPLPRLKKTGSEPWKLGRFCRSWFFRPAKMSVTATVPFNKSVKSIPEKSNPGPYEVPFNTPGISTHPNVRNKSIPVSTATLSLPRYSVRSTLIDLDFREFPAECHSSLFSGRAQQYPQLFADRHSRLDADYVLITPARNEEQYIEKTIQSVASQTVVPRRWIIVSDNSVDRTEEIVEHYAHELEFIRLVRVRNRMRRDFNSKVCAFNAGYASIDVRNYRYIGNLDADVSFGPEYYERILREFTLHPRLGIAGGIILEYHNGEYRERFANYYNISGAVQVFTRECYETIGGYIPLKHGGEDPVSQYMARMHGWDVHAVPELPVIHHRPTGTAQGNLLRACFRAGTEEYTYGSHPLFELAKCLHRFRERPFVLSGISRMGGYLWAFMKREPRIPHHVIRFIRHEQMKRLKLGKRDLAAAEHS